MITLYGDQYFTEKKIWLPDMSDAIIANALPTPISMTKPLSHLPQTIGWICQKGLSHC